MTPQQRAEKILTIVRRSDAAFGLGDRTELQESIATIEAIAEIISEAEREAYQRGRTEMFNQWQDAARISNQELGK